MASDFVRKAVAWATAAPVAEVAELSDLLGLVQTARGGAGAVTKRRGRPAKAAVAGEAGVVAGDAIVAPSGTGKRRGRPKGSKNAPKDVQATPVTEAPAGVSEATPLHEQLAASVETGAHA